MHSMIGFIYLPVETRTPRRPTPNFIDVLGLGHVSVSLNADVQDF